MGKYWNEKIECMEREEMLALQSQRLVKQVQHVWDNVPYYRKKWKKRALHRRT